MLNCSACVIPDECKKAAEALFPPGGNTGSLEAVYAFADALGIGADYRTLLGSEDPRSPGSTPSQKKQKYLASFRNNLDLLIRKTWVEKTDEDRKEKLQDRIPGLMELITNADYLEALEEFSAVLEELAWLLFGAQSRKDDFTEYTFRIDTQMGLFWWYAGHIDKILPGLKDRALTRVILLLGICYLTDF
ncbi:MAG: hypothetical protein LBI67_07940 [Treponema sp.]|jgi:hypothetical protein|nr:hypothetical protein [Treponema sp.]